MNLLSTCVQANNTARELQKRVEQLERINIEMKTRLDETTALYEQSQRDLRNKAQELQRTVHELDKTREQKDALNRENKKLSGQSTQDAPLSALIELYERDFAPLKHARDELR